MGAYLMNSLRAKRQSLQKDLRSAMARYASLERQHHPCLRDQGRYIELTKKMIGLVEAEMDNENTEALIASDSNR